MCKAALAQCLPSARETYASSSMHCATFGLQIQHYKTARGRHAAKVYSREPCCVSLHRREPPRSSSESHHIHQLTTLCAWHDLHLQPTPQREAGVNDDQTPHETRVAWWHAALLLKSCTQDTLFFHCSPQPPDFLRFLPAASGAAPPLSPCAAGPAPAGLTAASRRAWFLMRYSTATTTTHTFQHLAVRS